MKTLIAIPCMDEVKTQFFTSVIGLNKPEGTEVAVCSSSLIYDARNHLAQKAMKGKFDRVLWLDSDMHFKPDLLDRLSADLDEGREFVSALYFTRKAPIQPVVYSAIEMRPPDGNGESVPTAVNFRDYPKNSVFEIAGAGFGALMMTTGLIERIHENGWLPFSPLLGFSEDLSFCLRAREIGAKMWCDSRIVADHIAAVMVNESTYESR